MENVSHQKLAWLRSVKRGETKTGILDKPQECNTMSVLIYRYNLEEGPRKGIRITAKYDRAKCLITITANKILSKRDANHT